MKFRRAVSALLALLAGAIFPFGLAPFEVPLLSIAALALLALSLWQARGRYGFLCGYLFGLGKYGVGVYWIYVSIHVHGGASPLLAAALVAGFVAGLAILPGLFGWLTGRLFKGVGPLTWALALALLWTLYEWVLMWVLTGFPWLMLGHAQLGTPLQAFAPLAGVLLVTFASALSGTAFAAAWLRQPRWARGLCMALATLPWLAGLALWQAEWTQSGEPLRVALAQGNIPQEIKWEREHRDLSLDTYNALMDASWDADLIVLPEAAIPVINQAADEYLHSIEERALASDTGVIVGIPSAVELEERWQLHNTALGLGLVAGAYAKRHLVPFGEYVPFASVLRGLIGFFDLPMSHFVPGQARQQALRLLDDDKTVRLDKAGHPLELALAICYEIAYPHLVSNAASTPALLVTISNDAWFGRSIGPWQHLEIARMRALEQGRFLARATNNGVTAVVAPDGRVVAMLEREVRDVLRAELRLMHGETPYKRLGHTWLIVVFGLSLGALLWWQRSASAIANR